MRILVTGAAGFIGSALSLRLLARGDEVLGVDNLNDYYDVTLKQARLDRLTPHSGFRFAKVGIEDRPALARVFGDFRPERVVGLAAQAGVRHSIEHPHSCVESNLVGFINLLEACRHGEVEHLVYASSSSVYGANRKLPSSVHDSVDHPLSLYAATKKTNELMAHTYSHLYRLPTTGLRFFTVYGPWGRPDMALFVFTRNILAGEPIDVFNHGHHTRGFTYIDDIIEGVVRILDHVPTPDPGFDASQPTPAASSAPCRIYNIGHPDPVELCRYIEVLEKHLGRKAEQNLLPLQSGDVPDTCADVTDLIADIGYLPTTPVEVGIEHFVAWYRRYYGT